MFKMEMHAHCRPYSCDAGMNVQRLMNTLRLKNYHGVVLTNHFDIDYIKRFTFGVPECKMFYCCEECPNIRDAMHLYDHQRDYEKCYTNWFNSFKQADEIGCKLGIRVYNGVEYTCNNGAHILIHGCNRDDFMRVMLEPNKSIEYLRKWANKVGAVLIQAHPYRVDHIQPIFGLVDGWECFNTSIPDVDMLGPEILGQLDPRFSNGILISGGDCHEPADIGKEFMGFFREPVDEHELGDMLVNMEFNIGIIQQVIKTETRVYSQNSLMFD